MNGYAIMHMDRHVATVQGDGVCTVYQPQMMPCNLILEQTGAGDDLGTRMNNLNNFWYWCATRLLTLDRRYAKEILNSLGLKQAVTDRDRAQIAISYHALCLTDVFWVRALDEDIRYEQISLYSHSLSGAFVDVALRGKPLTAANAELITWADSAPDLSTLGVAPKAWIRQEDGFYLLKDGETRDVEAELTASRIARCFDVPQVLYEPYEFQGTRVSMSRLMTSPERSIVPAEYVEIHAANTGQRLWDIVQTHDLRGFHMMNILDYLVGNVDRHWGNWGFWVDNRDNSLGTLHPLMDFNRAFGAYDTEEGARCLTTEALQSQRDAAIAGVKAVGLNQRSPLPEDLAGCFARLNSLTGQRLEQMFLHRLELLRSCSA